MMTTDSGDNRIRLDQTPVDDSVRDKTGDLHDDYPSPNNAARYDFMQSYLIGLLSNQSSEDEPLEKHPGMTWFNKQTLMLMLYWDEAFNNLSNYIGVDTEDIDSEETVTRSLQDVLTEILGALQFVGPRVIWSGVFTTDEANEIPIPDDYQGYAAMPGMKPLVYLDGLLLDPRTTIIQPGNNTTIFITGGNDPQPRQEYTVILERVTDIKQETVPAPQSGG
jgi:hypothetical protein